LAKQYKISDDDRAILNMSCLFHDLGKLDPRAQKVKPNGEIGYSGNASLPKDQRITHEQSSGQIWDKFSDAIKLTNREKSSVKNIIQSHMIPHDIINSEQDMSQLSEFKDQNPLWRIVYIHAMADAMSKQEQPDINEAQKYDAAIQTSEQIDLPLLLNGNEIQQLLGIKPGKIIGEILNAIRQAQYKNFGSFEKLSLNEQKQRALDIAKSFLPHLLSREQVQSIVGIEPRRPPEGRPGYIQFVRNKIKEEQIKNPLLDVEQAKKIVQNMINSGELKDYEV